MTNIIPFESATLPAYLQNTAGEVLNDDLTAHSGAGFPVISIKGKVWAIVRDGERKVLPNPKDPDSPATSIDVVIVKANRDTSKVFYSAGYSEGAADKPDCFSNDGKTPDALVEKPQSKACFTCPQNVWGSKISESGKKVKACTDSVRIAVAEPALLNDPYLVRVPPATIRSLGEYGQMLKKRGVKYNQVVTKLSFDVDEPTPKLIFKPVGFLAEAAYKQVLEVAESDVVKSIIGSAGVPVADEVAALPAPEEGAAKVAKEAVEKAKAEKPKAAKEPVAAKPADPEVAIDLDDLKFDD